MTRERRPRLADQRRAPCLLAALTAALLLYGPAARAEQDLFDRSKLTGDWGGLRSSLSDAGYDFFAQYVTGGWANTVGGRKTGARHEGFGQFGMFANLEDAVGWTGSRFQIRFVSYHGGQPSEDLVGQFPAQNVSGWEANESFIRFYTIYLEQLLFGEMLQVKAGQLAADDDFMLSRVAREFSNATFGDITALGQGLSAPIYALAAPGLYVALQPNEIWLIRAGAYTGDTGNDESSNYGFDWSFDHKDGAVLAGEIGIRTRLFERDGSVLAGILGSTGRPERNDTDRGVYGLYLIADQDLLADARGLPSLAAFARLGYGPQENSARQRWVVDAGLVKYGVLGRRQDRVGLAFGYNRFSRDHVRDLRNLGENVTREQVLIELTYRARLTGWLSLKPNLQYIADPHFSRDDALVLGLLAEIDF